MNIKRIYTEKKAGYDIEAGGLFADLSENLKIGSLVGVRVINRYDVEGISEDEFSRARDTVFREPPLDNYYFELPELDGAAVFAYEYLDGQFDQRADSASVCIQILTEKQRPVVKTAKIIALSGDISREQLEKIKDYCINPLESREASLDLPRRSILFRPIPGR